MTPIFIFQNLWKVQKDSDWFITYFALNFTTGSINFFAVRFCLINFSIMFLIRRKENGY